MDHGVIDLGSRCTGEDQGLDAGHDLRSERFKWNVLIVAAGNQNDLLREGAQSRDRAGGRGSDRIVIIAHAVLDPDELDPVLDPAEAAGNGTDALIRDLAADGQDGSHVVFHVMQPGKQDVGLIHQPLRGLALSPDRPVAEEDAALRLALPGELQHPALCLGNEGMRDLVVHVEDQRIVRCLVQIEVLLCGHVFRHILVDVQMVRGQIRDHRHVRTVGEVHELERRELQHDLVRRLHLVRLVQKGRADVAAQPDAVTFFFVEFRNQRGGRRLAVGAGDGCDPAGADREEGLHLGGDDGSGLAQGLDLRGVRVKTRRAEYDVARKTVQIVRPQVELRAAAFEVQDLVVQLIPGRLVAAGDVNAVVQQQTDQRTVADADAQHQNALAAQRFKIGIQSCQIRSSFQAGDPPNHQSSPIPTLIRKSALKVVTMHRDRARVTLLGITVKEDSNPDRARRSTIACGSFSTTRDPARLFGLPTDCLILYSFSSVVQFRAWISSSSSRRALDCSSTCFCSLATSTVEEILISVLE